MGVKKLKISFVTLNIFARLFYTHFPKLLWDLLKLLKNIIPRFAPGLFTRPGSQLRHADIPVFSPPYAALTA